MKIHLLKIALLLISACTLSSAFADSDDLSTERILEFKSHIMVNADASIDVAEEITVNAKRINIKHGISRWLPTQYTDSDGISHGVAYFIKGVLCDNQTSPYHLSYNSKSIIIYIGDINAYVTPGIHTYTIKYHVDDAVNFLQDGDEIYWNVTGHDWRFDMQNVSAYVLLPPGANIKAFLAYTGKFGQKGTDYSVRQTADNQIEFHAESLSQNEGLTIAVAWQKGIVHPLTIGERFKNSFVQFRGQTLVIEIALAVFFYYLLVWHWFGRDPKPGTIVPLFEPPADLSPACVRYIKRMGYDMKTFSTAIISLANKGAIVIKDNAGAYILCKEKNPGTLSADELALYTNLFIGIDTIQLMNSNATILQDAKRLHKKAIRTICQSRYFMSNFIYIIPGVILTLLSCAIVVITSQDPQYSFFILIWLSAWTVGICIILSLAYTLTRQLFAYFSLKNLISAIGTILFSIPFIGGDIIGMAASIVFLPIFSIPILFFTAALNVIFYHLMKQPTKEGRKVMDQIDGFKLFLSTTERYRINQLPSITVRPEILEKLLPFAMALDVESEWGEQLNQAILSSKQDPTKFHPVWYRGNAWSTSSIASFPTYLSASINTSLISASISRSGSGGRGFSGGGRGGGGGGGW